MKSWVLGLGTNGSSPTRLLDANSSGPSSQEHSDLLCECTHGCGARAASQLRGVLDLHRLLLDRHPRLPNGRDVIDEAPFDMKVEDVIVWIPEIG